MEYFESSQLQLPGIGLGEKALESRTNGEFFVHLVYTTEGYLVNTRTYQPFTLVGPPV